MNWSCRIDWMTLTKRFTPSFVFGEQMNAQNAAAIAEQLFAELFGLRVEWEAHPANPFYRYAFKERSTGAVLHIAYDPSQQGVMLVCSGSVCAQLDNASGFLFNAYEAGYHLTRADVAFDVMNAGETVGDLAAAYRDMYGEKPPRKMAHVRKKGGETLYIGSRSSAKMVRVYDKAAEQKVQADWIRVELELKGDAADNAAEYLMDYPAKLGAVIVQVVGVPSSRLMNIVEDAAQGDVTVRSTNPRTSSNTLVWLLNSVLPSLERLMVENEAEYNQFIEALTAAESKAWNGTP